MTPEVRQDVMRVDPVEPRRPYARHEESRRVLAGFGSKPDKALPRYYITPTQDFTKYARDYETKYWNRDTAFDWDQDIAANLRSHLDRLAPAAKDAIATSALPIVEEELARNLSYVRTHGLPVNDDALHEIARGIPAGSRAMQQAFELLAPLEALWQPVERLNDQLLIAENEAAALRERKRLGMADAEAGNALASAKKHIRRLKKDLKEAVKRIEAESERRKVEVAEELAALAPQVVADLEAALDLVRRAVRSGGLPADAAEAGQLRELILKRQVRALQDIANHAIVAEQTAIAPLALGIVRYKRHREIQEAMTTFISDEAKHTAVFRRFLGEKLGATEQITAELISDGNTYMWLARFMPAAGMFLAVIVEAMGAASLEFFSENVPDPLLRDICKRIALQDEQRHMEICAAIYNELYRSGSRWERYRNDLALKKTMQAIYGHVDENHPLAQAFRVFGVAVPALYQHVASRLCDQLGNIGMSVRPEQILAYMRRG